MKSKAMLDRRKVKEIECHLKDKRVELTRSVQNVISECGTSDARRSADAAVLATDALHEEIQMALLDRHSRQLAQIEAALDLLARREYGLCRDCGEFIGLARLRVLPFAQRCRPCQARVEREEGRAQPVAATMVAVAM